MFFLYKNRLFWLRYLLPSSKTEHLELEGFFDIPFDQTINRNTNIANIRILRFASWCWKVNLDTGLSALVCHKRFLVALKLVEYRSISGTNESFVYRVAYVKSKHLLSMNQEKEKCLITILS